MNYWRRATSTSAAGGPEVPSLLDRVMHRHFYRPVLGQIRALAGRWQAWKRLRIDDRLILHAQYERSADGVGFIFGRDEIMSGGPAAPPVVAVQPQARQEVRLASALGLEPPRRREASAEDATPATTTSLAQAFRDAASDAQRFLDEESESESSLSHRSTIYNANALGLGEEQGAGVEAEMWEADVDVATDSDPLCSEDDERRAARARFVDAFIPPDMRTPRIDKLTNDINISSRPPPDPSRLPLSVDDIIRAPPSPGGTYGMPWSHESNGNPCYDGPGENDAAGPPGSVAANTWPEDLVMNNGNARFVPIHPGPTGEDSHFLHSVFTPSPYPTRGQLQQQQVNIHPQGRQEVPLIPTMSASSTGSGGAAGGADKGGGPGPGSGGLVPIASPDASMASVTVLRATDRSGDLTVVFVPNGNTRAPGQGPGGSLLRYDSWPPPPIPSAVLVPANYARPASLGFGFGGGQPRSGSVSNGSRNYVNRPAPSSSYPGVGGPAPLFKSGQDET